MLVFKGENVFQEKIDPLQGAIKVTLTFVLKETINIISSVFHCKLNRKRRSKLNRLCCTVVAPTALILSTIIRKANSFGNIVKIQNIYVFLNDNSYA